MDENTKRIDRRVAMGTLGLGASLAFMQKSASADHDYDVLKAKEDYDLYQEASVSWVRASDNSVYIWINDSVKGWVDYNPTSGNPLIDRGRVSCFAIAAAAEAARRKVWANYNGYDPNAYNGAGQFQFVDLMLDKPTAIQTPHQ